MTKRIWTGLASALLMAALLAAQKPEAAESLLQTAIKKEVVDGNLAGAIEGYKKALAAAKGNRAVAAKALIGMAECYQKLGDAQGRKIYEQVVREYDDQKDAVTTARARLGGNPATPTKGDRAVWTGSMVDSFGRVSPDGRFITFIDWTNGSLMVHDVAANQDHVLTPPVPKANSWGSSVFSRDGKQVIYAWANESERRSLRIAEFQGSRIVEPRDFFLANEDVRFIGPEDWSPDRKLIVATLTRKDGTTQVALISVADGSSRVLKTMGWNMAPGKICFSLDGKYIAYDMPASDASRQRDIYVLAIDGSRETPAVIHPAAEAVLGWSPDGTHLLFSSDRTGSAGLWALRFTDGRPQGTPELLRSDIGSSSTSLGLTSSGALYLYKSISTRDVRIAPIDLNAGKLTGPPMSFNQGFLPNAVTPRWSPDGKYLAYVAGNGIAIRSVETGQVRQLTTLPYVQGPHWSPDGRSFLAVGRDGSGRDGIFLIDVHTGALSPVVYTKRFNSTGWSHDGKRIYYFNEGSIVERDLASGAEREVIRRPGMWAEVNPSPDGRYLAVQTGGFVLSTERTLLLVPIAGGEPRELIRLPDPDIWGRMNTTSWTPDGTAILKVKRTSSGPELLLIPIDGSPVRKMDIDSGVWTRGAEEAGQDQGFSLSRDGVKIAFLTGKSASEVWAIENFLQP